MEDIFTDPFYYIDYALSYFGAFAIWNKCQGNLNVFKEVAKVASYYPLDELVKKFGISNPFEEKSVKELSKFLSNELSLCSKKIIR